jgi:hypothetical protein
MIRKSDNGKENDERIAQASCYSHLTFVVENIDTPLLITAT